jgi:hypothetical protein
VTLAQDEEEMDDLGPFDDKGHLDLIIREELFISFAHKFMWPQEWREVGSGRDER